jgi:hypothetical protein
MLQVDSKPLLPWSFLARRTFRVSRTAELADSAFPLLTNQDRGSAEGALRTPSPAIHRDDPAQAPGNHYEPPEAPRESGEL